jgi:hypothetical protein
MREHPTINEVVESKHELADAIGKLIQEFETKNHVIINSDITIKREYLHSGTSVGPLVYITIKI